ncbi:MAG: hypothetical protein ACO3NG_13175, partial [bacterium]
SLQNVRSVLIMEPYWNHVRTEQVIGRAIRNYSHKDLPSDKQNVQVFHYIMNATKSQIDNNPTFKTGDNEWKGFKEGKLNVTIVKK